MDRLAALVSLNEAKRTIEETIDRVKSGFDDRETDTRKLLVVCLSVLGALVLIGLIAFAVYKHFSADYIDDYDDVDDLADEDDEDPEVLVSDDDFADDNE